MILPKDTYLFRTTFKSYLEPVEDEDTGKIGLYFSNYPILALSMCLEYGSDMIYNIYQTTDDLELDDGKYSFRNINPSRYFKENGDFIPNVKPLNNEMVNHFDNAAYSIISYEFIHNPNLGEIFLNAKSLKHIQLVKSYKLLKKDIEEKAKLHGINSEYDYGFAF